MSDSLILIIGKIVVDCELLSIKILMKIMCKIKKIFKIGSIYFHKTDWKYFHYSRQ